MLEFNCPNRKFDGTPVVCDQQVMVSGGELTAEVTANY